MLVGLNVNINELVDNITPVDAEKLIIAADIAISDYDFTLKIVKKLIVALYKECKFNDESLDVSKLLPAKLVKDTYREYFDRPGPQVTKIEHGAEPSLSDMIALYYQRSGVSAKEAAKLRDKYINNFV